MRLIGVILVALVVSAGTAASATAAGRVLSVKPGSVNFGAKPLESFTLKEHHDHKHERRANPSNAQSDSLVGRFLRRLDNQHLL